MKKYFSRIMVLVGVVLLPSLAFAQAQQGGLFDIIYIIRDLFSEVVPVLVALAVVYFVYGVVMYMIADSEEGKTKGRDTIIFGIIGLAVIVSVWGLVQIILNTFQLDNPNSQSTKNAIYQLLP